MFLAAAAGESVEKPEPITREEMFLNAIGGGGGSGDAYTKAETDQLLGGKADLVGGKVPASELPAMSIGSLSDTAVDTPENGEVLKYDADQGKWVNGTASGGGGTTDYTDLTNKPKINNVTLSGNKTASDLGITEMELGETSTTAYAGNKGKANADAITAIKDGQSIDSFGDVETALADKVDKVSGKGLSTEDYTTAEKTKLAGIAEGAEVNVQSDWNQTDDTADDYIKNKPTIPAGVVVDQSYSAVSTNAQSGVAVAQAVSGKANSADLATVATSGSYADLSNKPTIPDELADLQDDSTHRVVTDAEKTAWSGKQAALVVGTNLDNTPTQGSTNPITSGAIYTGLAGKVDTNGTDSLMTAAEHTKLSNCKTAWKGTQAAYDLLPDHTTYDLYFIEEVSS